MFGSPAAPDGGVGHEQKMREKDEMIAKLQQHAQALKSENTALKSAPGSPIHVTELAKKDDMINRMRQEAKKVIDTLKTKHAEEIARLKNEHAQMASSKSDPASLQGPTAHVAALTAELASCKEKLSELEVNAEWVEADKQEAMTRAQEATQKVHNLQKQLEEKDREVAALDERLRAMQMEMHSAESATAAVEEMKRTIAQLEGRAEAASEREAELTERLRHGEANAATLEQRTQQLQDANHTLAEQQAGLEEERAARVRAEDASAAAQAELQVVRVQMQALEAAQAKTEEGTGDVQLKADSECNAGRLRELEDQLSLANSKTKEFTGAVEALENEKAGLKDALQQAEAKRAQLQVQVDELSAQLEQHRQEKLAESAAAGAQLAGLKKQLDEQQMVIDQQTVQLEQRASGDVTAKDTADRLAEKEEELVKLREELSTCESELQEASKERQQLKRAKGEADALLVERNKELQDLHEKTKRIKAEAQKAQEKNTMMREEQQKKIDEAEERANDAEARLEELKAEQVEQIEDEEHRLTEANDLEECKRAIAELNAAKARLQEEKDALEVRCQEEENVKLTTQERLRAVELELEEALHRRDDASAQASEQAARAADLEARNAKLEGELAELKTKNAALKEDNKKHRELNERALVERQKETASQKDQAQQLQMQIQELEEKNRHLEDRLEAGMGGAEGEDAATQQSWAQVLERADSLELQLRAKGEEVEQLQREIQGLRQLHGEDVASGNREAQETAPLGNGADTGDDGDDVWGGWHGSDSGAARDSSFANPQPSAQTASSPLHPQSPAQAGPLSSQQTQHGEPSELLEMAGHRANSNMADWNGAPEGHSHLTAQLQAIQRLAARCAGAGWSSADLASLLSHAEHLRPSLVSHWPRPAGETIEVGSWEELCMWLFAYNPSSSLEASSSPMVYCGMADRRKPLLTTAQEAGEKCQHSELAISQTFQRSARGLLSSCATQVEWMALGQRHGLPTRMINFSSSPFAAVHAALLDSEDEDAVVWCVDAAACNQSCNYYAEWVQDVQWFRRRRSAHPSGRRQAPPGQRDKTLTPEDVEDLVEYCQCRSESQEAVGLGGSGGAGVDMDADGSRDESAGSNPADALNLQVLGDVVLFMEAPSRLPALAMPPHGGAGAEEAIYGAALGTVLGAQGHVVAVMGNAYQRLEDWLLRRPSLYRRIIIPASLKAQVRAHLDAAGFSERTLDPGLDGLCAWIKRRYR